MELSDATLMRLLELFRGFPLLPIRTEAELERAQAVVDELLGRERDEAEELYLDVLGTLIHAYEEEHVAIPELSGLELLRALIVERGLSQRDLVRAGIFATDSVASEVLAGKRSLNADQVRALAGYFHLPADLFLRQPQAAAQERSAGPALSPGVNIRRPQPSSPSSRHTPTRSGMPAGRGRRLIAFPLDPLQPSRSALLPLVAREMLELEGAG